MRRFVAIAGAVAVLLAGCTGKAPMTAQDARTFTSKALAKIGYAGAIVDTQPARTRYKSPDPRFQSDPPVDVWQTRAVVPGGEIELFVQRRGDSAVFVRDTSAGGGRLLSDDQFRALGRFRLNPADKRRRDSQRTAGAIGVALVVAAAASLFATVLTGAADRRQRLHSSRRR